MAKKSDPVKIPLTRKNSPRLNIHFLDYSISEFADLCKKEAKAKKKGKFIPNRQNLTTAIWECPTFDQSLSGIIDRNISQFVPIPLETSPFFQNYIDSIRQNPKWKETVKQEVSDELLNDFFQNAYDSIKASPDALAYYEKALCHTDAYCRFAASKVWEEELDQRCTLLRELLSKHSGRTQLDGLANLLRTLDMYIAVYSKPPAQKESPSAEACLQEILDSLIDLRWDGSSAKSATAFLLGQKIPPFDYAKLMQEPLSEQDAAGLAEFDNQSLISLEFINYMNHNKRRFSKEFRSNTVKIARKKYLTSRVSKVEPTRFWEAYQDIKHYLHGASPFSKDEALAQTTQAYLSRYYLNIWTNGTLPSYSPNINRKSTVSEVALDGLAKEAAEYFVRSNAADISHFRKAKNHIITFFYQYSTMLSNGSIPCVSQASLLSDLALFVKKMAAYIGGTFEQDFSGQLPDLTSVKNDSIVSQWSSTLVQLYADAIKSLNILENKAIVSNAVVSNLEYVLPLIHHPDFVYPLWRLPGVNQDFCHTAILDYITFILKMYYDFLDASKEVAEVFRLYCSYMEEKQKQEK